MAYNEIRGEEMDRENGKKFLGKTVRIEIDRPMGTVHPAYPDLIYPINYGYIPGVTGGDGEEQDVYLLGVDHPVREYAAKVIGIVYRQNDTEYKLIAAPEGRKYSCEEVQEAICFQERYFHSTIEMAE